MFLVWSFFISLHCDGLLNCVLVLLQHYFCGPSLTSWSNYDILMNGTCCMPMERVDRPGESQEATRGKKQGFKVWLLTRNRIFDSEPQPMLGSRVLGVPSAALATVSSSNHVGRRILTPIPFCDRASSMFSRRRLWHTKV